jgi:uncharacterized RDD family membrane protein YckC
LAALLAQIADDDEVTATPTVGSALTAPTDVSRPSRPETEAVAETAIRFDPVFASFGERAVGLIVDALVLGVFLLPGIVVAAAVSGAGMLLGVAVMAAGFVAATVVNTRAVSRAGQTIGNRVASSKVVDARNGNLVDHGAAATRYVLRFLISPILFLGFIVAFTNPERRTFHDKFAGTIVTRPPRASWSIDDETTPPTAARNE